MENQNKMGFFFETDGKKVVNVRLSFDYAAHRIVEEVIEQKSLDESLRVICQVFRDNSFSQQLCFAQGVEKIARIEVPPRAKFIRTVVGELERIYGHLFWLGTIGMEVGHPTLPSYILQDQQLIIELVEILFGFPDWGTINIIGGVSQDIIHTPSTVENISNRLGSIENNMAAYEELMLNHEHLSCRFEGIGMIKKETAHVLGAVGPLARASGLQRDVRKNDAYAGFDSIDFNLVCSEYGDVLARILVIFEEVYGSIYIVQTILDNISNGEIYAPNNEWVEFDEVLSRVEVSQGETLQYLQINSNMTTRLKIRQPTMANLATLLELLKNTFIADIPVVIASVDPHFFGVDTITLKESNTGKTRIYSRDDLRDLGIKWYNRNKQDG